MITSDVAGQPGDDIDEYKAHRLVSKAGGSGVVWCTGTGYYYSFNDPNGEHAGGGIADTEERALRRCRTAIRRTAASEEEG